jgi:restriction system-associated AAA family ATPase
MDYHYFDDFEAKVNNKKFGKIDINRMFFMDYDSNKMVLLANYLIQQDGNTRLEKLSKELKINDVRRFSISIRLKDYNKRIVKLPSELNLIIDKLKHCATTWDDNNDELPENQKHKRIIHLDYYVDIATKKAFRYHFKTSFELYRSLYLLRLLNIHAQKVSIRNEARAGKRNVSSIESTFEPEDVIFHIDKIAIKKHKTSKPIKYKNLSDGEHQMLHILGTLLLMGTDSSIFILDEPETHFNPEWRSKLVKLINDCAVLKYESTTPLLEAFDQEYFITSHSPFIVSDCKRENVYVFFRNKNNYVTYRQMDNETFGASVSVITDEVFGKRETISDKALSKIFELQNREINSKGDLDEVKREAINLGDSVERMILLSNLKLKEDKLKK